MSVSVDIELGYEFTVKAPRREVFDLLADVPTSVSHFPKVERLVDLGGGVYRWEMQRVGTPQVHIQTVYACRYTSNRSKGLVAWSPVAGVGNAQIAGYWKVAKAAKGTHCELHIQGTVEVALPALTEVVVVPVVRSEFEHLVERYIDHLVLRFGGEV